MKVKKCRNCNSTKTEKLFSLGDIPYSGFFPKNKNTVVEKKNLTLMKCKICHLVQLNEKFNPKKLYNNNYGYRTGINKTMTNHVKNLAKKLIKITKLKKNESVLDIASNDATLLNFYNKNIIKCGCDPLIPKFKNLYKKINYILPDFFSAKGLINIYGYTPKFKIITAVAVFYDLESPNSFLNDIHKILSNDGIFVLEMADLGKIIKNVMFDTICHEHLEYYSCEVIIEMAKKNNLEVIDIEYNSSNGGSSRFYICQKNSKYKIKHQKIKKILKDESKIKLKSAKTYRMLFNKIHRVKEQLIETLTNIKSKNQKIFGYGASTKGNILLEYFGINKKLVNYIAERNPEKYNKFTPSGKIPIISEAKARRLKPDYYLVLPWHFKNEILIREKSERKRGAKFIFPLPKLTIY
ncbi:MAG: methyltransferase domain-containing protein [Candidatus Pelagibacter sp.]